MTVSGWKLACLASDWLKAWVTKMAFETIAVCGLGTCLGRPKTVMVVSAIDFIATPSSIGIFFAGPSAALMTTKPIPSSSLSTRLAELQIHKVVPRWSTTNDMPAKFFVHGFSDPHKLPEAETAHSPGPDGWNHRSSGPMAGHAEASRASISVRAKINVLVQGCGIPLLRRPIFCRELMKRYLASSKSRLAEYSGMCCGRRTGRGRQLVDSSLLVFSRGFRHPRHLLRSDPKTPWLCRFWPWRGTEGPPSRLAKLQGRSVVIRGPAGHDAERCGRQNWALNDPSMHKG